MLIFFEDYSYPEELISKYLTDKDAKSGYAIPVKHEEDGWRIQHIGYLFVSNEKYKGPVFILPKLFLSKVDGKDTLLGRQGIFPENIYDTDKDENPLTVQGYEYFLPELSLWLFRAIARYRDEAGKDKDQEAQHNLDYVTPDNNSQDQDFLSTAIHLIDFLSDHRNLFTQITKINNSGHSSVDWHKTIQTQPFIKDKQPYYTQLLTKDKSRNIDEELIVLYYSVLKYLKDKFHFRISLGEINYDLKSTSEIQRYLDTGIGKRRMRDMKGKYYRDDLRSLWSLLDAFFTFNSSKDDKNPIKEKLIIKNFELVFEKMVDNLIGDTGRLSELKTQKDGKLIDHIYLDNSLLTRQNNIYYIGDSKYYNTDNHPVGVALYKQFTYARNAIQYNIEQYHLRHKENPNAIRYRDDETEGYNITPNFFIIPTIESRDFEFNPPTLTPSEWHPKTSRQFEDRLFDRDTLILREYKISLISLIAAYGAYESSWTTPLRKIIREDMISFLNDTYTFFEVTPKPIPIYAGDKKVTEIPFLNYHHNRLKGKVYKTEDNTDKLTIAFERNSTLGKSDLDDVRTNIVTSISGGSIDIPIELKP
mgnify:FL=1